MGKQGLLEMTENLMHAKNKNEMKRMGGSKTVKVIGIKKLDDAHFAGKSKEADKCTIILTEGDSAKTFAVAGLGVVGRRY